jgi:hypothetical protein
LIDPGTVDFDGISENGRWRYNIFFGFSQDIGIRKGAGFISGPLIYVGPLQIENQYMTPRFVYGFH